MKLHPFQSAVLAAGYIALIVMALFQGSHLFGEEDNLLMPMVMLSLLVLSVAIMAFLFFYEPVRLLTEGKRTEAVSYFMRTIATFAGIALVLSVLSILISNFLA